MGPISASAPNFEGRADSTNKPASKWKNFFGCVWRITQTAFKVLVGLGLYITNPSFFAVGLVAGIIFHDKMRDSIDKIIVVWNKQPAIVSALVIVGGFLSLPVTLATASFLFAGHLGSKMATI